MNRALNRLKECSPNTNHLGEIFIKTSLLSDTKVTDVFWVSGEGSEDVSVMLAIIPQDTYIKNPDFMFFSSGRKQYAYFVSS